MLNIVVPMAGAGSRFAKAGYKDPKPLTPIIGEPMIRVAIENLRPSAPYRYIFICQRAHLDAFGLAESLADDTPEALFKRADQALNLSKNGGRNRVSAAAA